jgi:ferritin-like protein
MPEARIRTVEDLHRYLYAAMQLEHGTLPPYLTALYSLHPNTNVDAYDVIRVVAVEEMLHLTLAANLLNAVGGTPDLTQPGFVPSYPAYLPDGEDDFQVHLMPFSREAIEMFLNIERPNAAPTEEDRLRPREGEFRDHISGSPPEPGMRFYSIGDFYEEIRRGLEHLTAEMGEEALFRGDPAHQVGAEQYYSGGGDIVKVTDLESATEAIRTIAEQGEGLGGGIYDNEGELAHYYRFKQLAAGRYYQQGDTADEPTGPPVNTDWEAVFPLKRNARLDDYPEGSELRAAAEDFNRQYGEFLALLSRAFSGQPDLLIEAVAGMFRLKERMSTLIRNPIPGQEGVNGAPTFEVAVVAGAVAP